ncbi:hypothetical protein JAAARDRAFT_198890 [Jaapia argillacea MUCL 33604]|uniref:Uncharacterized protein n=1 Tax=Jaapia argillacea MUCL 33604 TaxID=933084 RepID=A0A067PKQ7_9AGAM|nr:hypothetical protein JAAARDRAFT_198890 [Jaapia argillacea MUCL 33604]
MQYRNGLIGKHFKSLSQTLAFHIHGLVTTEQFTLVKAAGELGAMLWIHEIDDMNAYLADLDILINNLLDAFGNLDPLKIITKAKLHILTHLPQDIPRYGPAVCFSTEIFECFNAVFQMCSVLSNHQAPSRDIAYKNADIDRVKHLISGGYWFEDGSWIYAGKDVWEFMKHNMIMQRHFGWAPRPVLTPGSIKLPAWGKVVSVYARQSLGFRFASARQTAVLIGSWVMAHDDENNTNVIGRVAEIIQPKTSTSELAESFVTLERFSLAEALHANLGMPILRRASEAEQFVMVAPTSVLFPFNIQHDCSLDDDHFIINTHALHNAMLLRKHLPIYLTIPRPLYPNRKERHHKLLTVLRDTQLQKRAQAKLKRDEKKKLKQTQESGVLQSAPSPDKDNSLVSDSDDSEGDVGSEVEAEARVVQGGQKRQRKA